ncbi:MAG: (d)CMP kinase [Victivallales bacterium]|nr:(d)CMP kinase [Victivallales bacterium]
MAADVIAIDGPAASGKSTIAARIAGILGIPYINTGNMYRAVTFYALTRGVKPCRDRQTETVALLDRLILEYRRTDNGTYELFLNGEAAGAAIRTPEVTACVSQAAAMPEVRTWLLRQQRDYANLGRIVMEGRDIGTVVFPDAAYKFFLTASPEARARRRLGQAGETPADATIRSVAAEIAARDRLDSSRAAAPLRQAPDAVLIDSTELTIDQVVDIIIARVRHADH